MRGARNEMIIHSILTIKFYVMKKFLTLCTALLLFGSMTVVQAGYYVAGSMNGWNTEADGYQMSLAGSVYKLELNSSGSVEFKVVQNNSWATSWPSADYYVGMSEAGKLVITYNPENNAVYADIPGQYAYTLVGGSAALFGSTWDPTATANDMTLQSDGLTYQITYSNVHLTSGFEYKVVRNHAWGTGEYPASGNQTLNISGEADYNVTFTYVPSIPELTAVATPLTPSTPDTYTVVGEVPGLNWDQTNSANDMTEDNGIYTLTFTNVELAVGNYNYKIVKNHSWVVSYPQDGNDQLSISVAGIYNLTFTLDLSASTPQSVTPTLVEPAVVIPAIKMSGTFAGGEGWTETAEFTLASNNESASLTLENLPAGNYDFKVIRGSSWLGNGHSFYRDYTGAANIGEGDNMHLEADVAGNYTFTWTFENDSLGIDFPAEPTPEYAEIKFFAPRDETNKWEHVYAYSYKGLRKFLGEWPGTEITSTKDAGWYTVSVRKGSNLIFTDNAGMETNAIENIQADACYESRSIYYPADPEEAKKVTVEANANCAVAYHIAGSAALVGGEADFDTNLPLDENNQIVFHDVEPGTYAFKINNGTWAWSIAGEDHMKEGDCATIATTVGQGDLGFVLGEKQDVTVTYYPATQEICLGAVTIKTPGVLTVEDKELYVGQEGTPIYETNIDAPMYDVTYTFVSGDDCVEILEYGIKGKAVGTAVVKMTIEETENFTSAEANFTVTVMEAPLPPDYGSYQRTITEGKYGTICLPKSGKITGATLFEIADYDGNMIYLDETATNDILGGTPYIFLATSNQLNVAYGSNVELEANHHNGLYGFYDLTGVNHVYTLAQNDGNYILYNNQYWSVNGRDAYIEEYRAYIRLDKINNVGDPAPGRRRVAMTVNGNQTATGIDALNADEAPQKLIINGQLYILRGEKMYDVTGQVVK